ncbi:hypothetical protein KY362_02240, partial [Candidatus Woesearchaeota archaeon]|nr:hypothetical protein [Candidatus Woesearchaeota archaeon]
MAVIDTWINYALPEAFRAEPGVVFVLGNKYLVALAVLVVFFVLSKLVIYLTQKVILGLTAKTKTKIDDYIVDRTNGPISWLLVFIGLKISFEYLDYTNGFAWLVNNVILTLIYF